MAFDRAPCFKSSEDRAVEDRMSRHRPSSSRLTVNIAQIKSPAIFTRTRSRNILQAHRRGKQDVLERKSNGENRAVFTLEFKRRSFPLNSTLSWESEERLQVILLPSFYFCATLKETIYSRILLYKVDLFILIECN